MRRGGAGDLHLLRRLAAQARPCWPHLALLVAVSLLGTPLTLLAPLPVQIAVDSVIGGRAVPGPLAAVLPASLTSSRTAMLWFAAGLAIAIALLLHVQGLASWLLQSYTGERLVRDLRARMFAHAQRVSLSYHDRRGVAEALYRLQSDAHAIQHVAIGLIPFFTSTVTLVAMIYVVARIDWSLALVALAISPVLFVLAGASRRRLRERWGKVKALESGALSVAHEVLSALRVVKAFGREEHEHDRFVRHASGAVRGQVALAAIEGSFDLLVGLTLALGTAVVLYLGVSHVLAGTLTLGALLVILAYLAQLYAPLEAISKRVADLQSALVSAERAFALLDEAPDVVERPDARPLRRARGAVELRDVTFAYDGRRPVLDAISFGVPPGARVGIVGASGAGKTTLVNLLFRFYDATAGTVLLDGVDVREWRVRDLRGQFAIVLQEPVLFSASIGENIAYARPEATVDEIAAAARAANAHHFIERLPDGYATQVGERGMGLSGGERQRIALARAFLKDAPILVLDEPTSAVDADTEALVVEAMERLMVGRTTFIIAHRPAALRGCDVVLRLEGGRLVDTRRAARDEPVAVVGAAGP